VYHCLCSNTVAINGTLLYCQCLRTENEVLEKFLAEAVGTFILVVKSKYFKAFP